MMKEYSVDTLKELVKERKIDEIKKFMIDNDLIIDGNRIVSKYRNEFQKKRDSCDLNQYIKKIFLNSEYGNSLQIASVFFDFRLGASTTMSGRQVVKHLTSKANELLCGVYADKGYCAQYNDTDSQKSDSIQYIKENGVEKQVTIEELFNKCDSYHIDERTGKEYGFTKIEVLGFDKEKDTPKYYPINYVYRHKTSKPMWEIEDENSNIVTVTNDHSCMVERNGELIVVKPYEILEDDILIVVDKYFNIVRSKIKRCECVGNFNDEYVYDIGVHHNTNQWVFANNILVHNSVYCYINNEHFKKHNPNFVFTKDNIIKLSDEVSEKINESFSGQMKKIFHCTEEASKIEKAAKEIVATTGLFVSKKRYALLVYEHDGFRKDVGKEIGEMKIMGIQVKRSDTPAIIRTLLKDMLTSLLQFGDKEKLKDILRDFGNNKWKELKPWEKGSPKTCNKLAYYTDIYNKTKKCSVGQVMASINWNILLKANNDMISPQILDGNKVIVCKLKKNNVYGMNSIAYPLDITTLPKWFKQLPFDEQSMKDSVVDKTIDTVFGVLNWKLSLEGVMNEMTDIDDYLTFM